MRTVSKIDAAKENLEAAIELHFSGGSTIAAHTLASAALWVLEDLCRTRRVASMSTDFFKMIAPAHHQEIRNAIKRGYNFFKHARTDAEKTLEFPEDSNDVLLMLAVENYRRLGALTTPLMTAHIALFTLIHPDYFRNTPVAQMPQFAKLVASIERLPKRAKWDFGHCLCAMVENDRAKYGRHFDAFFAKYGTLIEFPP